MSWSKRYAQASVEKQIRMSDRANRQMDLLFWPGLILMSMVIGAAVSVIMQGIFWVLGV